MNPKVKLYLEQSKKYYIDYVDCDITDYEYDLLCNDLYKNYDQLSEEDKSFVDIDDLKAGTGYAITREVYERAGLM